MDSKMKPGAEVLSMIGPGVVSNWANVPLPYVEDMGRLQMSRVFRFPFSFVLGPLNPRADAEYQAAPWIEGGESHERVVLMLSENYLTSDSERDMGKYPIFTQAFPNMNGSWCQVDSPNMGEGRMSRGVGWCEGAELRLATSVLGAGESVSVRFRSCGALMSRHSYVSLT